MADIYDLADQYNTIFDPVAYAGRYGRLTNFKGSDVQVNVQQGMLQQQFNVFKQNDIKGHQLLELGTGPTIHYSVIPSLYFDKVYLSDYAEGCRNVIKNWINKTPDALNFDSVYDYISKLHEERIKPSELEQSLRTKIKDVLKCDVLLKNPLEPLKMADFDCVICCGVLEGASSSINSFLSSFKHVADLLKPNGHFISSFFLGSSTYPVGDENIKSLTITTEHVKNGMENAGLTIVSMEEKGFDEEEIETRKKENELFSGYGTAYGRKI